MDCRDRSIIIIMRVTETRVCMDYRDGGIYELQRRGYVRITETGVYNYV